MVSRVKKVSWNDAVRVLTQGEVAIIPTDTVYGIVASALREESSDKLYHLKGRSFDRKNIILIDDPLRVQEMLGDPIFSRYEKIFEVLWPGPVSIVVHIGEDRDDLAYIHRGSNSIAFRVPEDEVLRNFLKKTGPLAAPSANKEGSPTAQTVEEAFAVFGNAIPCYVDGGVKKGFSSTLMTLDEYGIHILRGGTFPLADIEEKTGLRVRLDEPNFDI